MTTNKNIRISQEVQQQLINRGKFGVVALETTVLSHGLPYPENLNVAIRLEEIIRNAGLVPATIGVINGQILVGMSREHLRELAVNAASFSKLSRRDIAACVARKGNGSTTVSATVFIAHKVGLGIFVTGGLGGVHRGANDSWDVSTDLTELGRTPVVVVCAGAKSVLDIPKTLEVLETQGVEVVGYKTDVFPLFLTAESEFQVPYRCDSPLEVANLVRSHFSIGINSGIVLAVPIPKQHELPLAEVEQATHHALDEAVNQGITGAQTTPFLLKRIQEITGGKSTIANIKLLENNAIVAVDVLKALYDIAGCDAGNCSAQRSSEEL
eukprot:GHVN01107228.1.p1 GENE.GHVN01107228.1~~GHVN01107228.1.p1  ORF type:complete len:326 (+),score=34.56 GHVN01107228.1:27-1004(+)